MIDPHFYTLRAPILLSDLTHQLGLVLPIEGASDEKIEVPSELAGSLSGSITFFSDKRRKSQLKTARATACITTERLRPLVEETGMIALVADDPRALFAKLSGDMVSEGGSDIKDATIDKTAIIHPSASIGDNVSIGAFTRIGANSVIDDGVVIGANCVIEPLVRLSFTKMGDNCHVKSGAIVGGTGFGMVASGGSIQSIPHLGRVIIENDVYIGSNSCVDRGQLGDTTLQNFVKIDNLVQIGHNVSIGEGTMIAGHAGISGSCVIGKNCLLGGRASLSDHITLEDETIIAAFAGVMTNLPGGQMYSGVPAMPIRDHMRTVATLKKMSKL
jgi:UDP-3-O-[3-hydroxymyristoyl] glucosamine N-acyltransferase